MHHVLLSHLLFGFDSSGPISWISEGQSEEGSMGGTCLSEERFVLDNM